MPGPIRQAIQNFIHRNDSGLNGCQGGDRNVTPRCIASGASASEGGYTVTRNLNSQTCMSNIVGVVTGAPPKTSVTVTQSAAPVDVPSFRSDLKTGDAAVEIGSVVKAKIVNGRIVAEISLDGALTNATSVSYKLEGDKISGKPASTDLKSHVKSHGAELQTEKSGGKFIVSPAGKYDSMTLTFIRSDGREQEIKITRDQIRNVNGSPVAAAGAAPTTSSPSDLKLQTTLNATTTSPQPAIVPSSPPTSSEELTVQKAAEGVVNAVNAVTKAMRFDSEESKQDIVAKLESNIDSKIRYPLANITMSRFDYVKERAEVIKEAGPALVEAIKKHIEPRQKLIVDALIKAKGTNVDEIRGLAKDLKEAQSYWTSEASRNQKLEAIADTIKKNPGIEVLAGLVWDVEYRGMLWNRLDFVSQLNSAKGGKASPNGEQARGQEQPAARSETSSTEVKNGAVDSTGSAATGSASSAAQPSNTSLDPVTTSESYDLKRYLAREERTQKSALANVKSAIFKDLDKASSILDAKTSEERLALLKQVGIQEISATIGKMAYDDRPAAVEKLIGDQLKKTLDKFNGGLSTFGFWPDKEELSKIDALSQADKELLSLGWDAIYRGKGLFWGKSQKFQAQLDLELSKPPGSSATPAP